MKVRNSRADEAHFAAQSADYRMLLAERDRYEQALIECARISGADMSDGPPTWPPVDEWAVRCVSELRADYDHE